MPHTKSRNSSVLLDSRAYAKCVAVGMTKVELPDAPGFIGRRPGHDQIVLQRQLMCRVNLGWRPHPPLPPLREGCWAGWVPVAGVVVPACWWFQPPLPQLCEGCVPVVGVVGVVDAVRSLWRSA